MIKLKEFNKPEGIQGAIYDLQMRQKGHELRTSAGVQHAIDTANQIAKIERRGVYEDGTPCEEIDTNWLRYNIRRELLESEWGIRDGVPIDVKHYDRIEKLKQEYLG